MTSGQFHSVSTSSIQVLREERQRKELRNIDELAESIHRIGLIHPLVVTRDLVLVAGERRLTAIRTLGWTSVSVQYVDDLPEADLHAIELEENIKRQDITWQERALAMERYQQIRTAQTGQTVSQNDLAKELGLTSADVSRNISVAKELLAGNERVMKADKFSTALNSVLRENQRKQSSAVTKLEAKATSAVAMPGEVPVIKEKVVPLLNEDFHEWAAAYCGPKFNLIHCDFPYGVGMHKSDQGAGQEFGQYADTKDVYFALIETLEMSMSNVIHDSAHLVFWFSMDYYEYTRAALTNMGWRVNPFPLVWFKSDNTGIIPDAQRGPRRVYETAFFASRGDRLLTQKGAVSNVFAGPGRGKEIHMNEKPVPMLQHFLSMVCDEYSLVLDPTAGSANVLKAATALGAPTVLGLERDTEFYARSVDAYYAEPGLGL